MNHFDSQNAQWQLYSVSHQSGEQEEFIAALKIPNARNNH